MEHYVEKNLLLDETQNARDLVGLRVLSVSGEVLGRVKHVQLHHMTHAFEGVIVKRGLSGGSYYICNFYIQRITHDALLLGIEPAMVYLGRKVISSDGKVFGRVKEVHRMHQTNQIIAIVVKHGFFRKVSIPFNDIKKLDNSIILKKTYAEARKIGS